MRGKKERKRAKTRKNEKIKEIKMRERETK